MESWHTMELKKLRKQSNITQKEIASQLGVSFQTYSAWETERTQPSIEMLKKLALFFDVTIDELLGLKSQTKILDHIQIEYQEIIDIFKRLTPKQQESLLGYARGMEKANEIALESGQIKSK